MSLNEQERENLVAYLDGELDAETARSIEARISIDPQVRAEAEKLKQVWEMLDYLPNTPPSQDFTNRTLQKLSAHRPQSTMKIPPPTPRLWLVRLAWAGFLMLAAGVGFAAVNVYWDYFTGSAEADNAVKVEEALLNDLRVIQNLPLYRNVDDIELLRKLDDPNLFGEGSF